MIKPDIVFLGLLDEAPSSPAARGNYTTLVVAPPYAYTSGHVSLQKDGTPITGKLGEPGLSLEKGQMATRQAGLAILATLQQHLGTLNRVKQVIKIVGFINSFPTFVDHALVLNGCSDLFAQVFGPIAGVGVRSALGVSSLPRGVVAEVDVIVELIE